MLKRCLKRNYVKIQYLLDQHKILQDNAEIAARAVDISSQRVSDMSRETRAESKRKGVGAKDYQEAQTELSAQARMYTEQQHLVDLLKNEINEAGTDTNALTAAVTELSASKGFQNQSLRVKELVAALKNGTITSEQFEDQLNSIEFDQEDEWISAVDSFSEATQTSVKQADQLGAQLVRAAQDEITLAEASEATSQNVETLTERFKKGGSWHYRFIAWGSRYCTNDFNYCDGTVIISRNV